MVKNPPANAKGIRHAGWIPESGRSPGGGDGIPLQYSCLENPMVREVWRATIHGVTKSQTQLRTHTHTHRVVLKHVYRSFLLLNNEPLKVNVLCFIFMVNICICLYL